MNFDEMSAGEQLAMAIKLAAKYREESFDHKKSEEWQKEDIDKSVFHDYNKCYRLSLRVAAEKGACDAGFDTRGREPVYLLLKYCWNDILEWVKQFD